MRKSFIFIGTIITTLGIVFSPISSKASCNIQVMPGNNLQAPSVACRKEAVPNPNCYVSTSNSCNLNQFLQEYLARNYPALSYYFTLSCPGQESSAPNAETPCGPEEQTSAPGEVINTPEEQTPAPGEAVNTPEEQTPAPGEVVNTPEEQTPAPGEAVNTPEEQTPAPDEVLAPATYEEQVVALVNEERAKEGLPALKVDETLQAAALARAKETVQRFSHTRPNGASCFTILKEYGISYHYAGENIAYGQRTPEEVVGAWMNSAGHRANIMSENFTTIGIGYYQTANGTKYWSQLFLS